MPFLPLTTPTGQIEMHYSIATPTSISSESILADLPCVLFLHSGWSCQDVFEAQFNDPRLRSQFNLIGIDMRGYGQTKGLINKQGYSPTDSADDVHLFIKALNLPPLHLFGLALGCCVALEIASSHPDLVRSLTLCSPVPQVEPEGVAAGRQELYQLWIEAFEHDPNGDPAFLADLNVGIQQLCFNNVKSSLGGAIYRYSVQTALVRMKNRETSPEGLEENYYAIIGWFMNRQLLPRDVLAKIQCSVRLIHCEEDIAYALHYTEELMDDLNAAGVPHVKLHEVSGPHYGNVLNPENINGIILSHVLECSYPPDHEKPLRVCEHGTYSADNCKKMTTPFTKRLESFGYDPHEGNDEDEDDSDFHVSY